MTLAIMTDSGPVDEALLDGYGFGDRLLEGVMFRITIKDGAINCPGVHAKSQRYADSFTLEQVAQWQVDAEEHCRSLGDDLETESGEEAWIEDDGKLAAPAGEVRVIEAQSFGDISQRIVGKLNPYTK